MTDTPWKDSNTSSEPDDSSDSLQFPTVSFDEESSSSSSPSEEAPDDREIFSGRKPDSSVRPGQWQQSSPFKEDEYSTHPEANPQESSTAENSASAIPEAPPENPSSEASPPQSAEPQASPKKEDIPGPVPGDVFTPDSSSQGANPYAHRNGGYDSGPYGPQQTGSPFYSPPGYSPYNDSRQPPTYSPMGGTWDNPPAPHRPGRQQKIYLGVIGLLAVFLIAGFIVYGISSSVFGDPDSPPLFTESSSAQDEENPVSSQTESSTPSSTFPPVVSENTPSIEIQELPSSNPLTAKEVYQKVSPSVVGIVSTITDEEGNSTTDQGSGIVATEDGYIITNSHVVNDSRSTQVKVVTKDDEEYTGTVVGYDRNTDLAIVKIDAEGLVPAEFGDADAMEVGDTVLAIGNPGGLDYASSMTRGIISALNRKLSSNSDNGMTYIQTDAAINPGNSGGALVNEYGQVIGINSSKLVAEDFEGMGFAIPVSKAQDILNSLIKVGYVEGRTRLGITGRDITAQQAEFYGVPQGFLIMEIGEDSNIGTAGGQVEDIICAINGETVTCLSDISAILMEFSPGDEITLTVYRRSEERELDLTITLLEDKGETQSNN